MVQSTWGWMGAAPDPQLNLAEDLGPWERIVHVLRMLSNSSSHLGMPRVEGQSSRSRIIGVPVGICIPPSQTEICPWILGGLLWSQGAGLSERSGEEVI